MMLQLMTVSCLLACGMGVAILESIKVPLARKLNIDEARVGGLVSMFAVTMIPVIFCMGFLSDLVGKQQVLIAGSVIMALSLVLLGSSRSYLAALVGVLLLSAGWSAQINVINVIMPDAFGGDTAAYAMNLGNVFFGLGAFLTPLAVAFMLQKTTLSPALCAIAVLVLTTTVLALGVDFSPKAEAQAAADRPATDQPVPAEKAATADNPKNVSQDDPTRLADANKTNQPADSQSDSKTLLAGGMFDLLTSPLMWILGLCLFFYGPLEASVAAWATSILGERGVKEQSATSFLSAFWLAFMLSRLIAAFAIQKGSETTVVIALAAMCVAVLTVLVLSRTRGLAIAMVVLAGFVFGPIFPTVMGILVGITADPVKGRAVGLFFAIGGVGWTGVPMLIGAYARKTNVQRAFLIAVGAAVGLTVVALVLHFTLAAYSV